MRLGLNALKTTSFEIAIVSSAIFFIMLPTKFRIFLFPMINIIGQMMAMVKTKGNVAPINDRGFSARMTNIITVDAHNTLDKLIVI